MIEIPRAIQERLATLATEGYPNEVCGLLVGRQDGDRRVVERIRPAGNLTTDRRRDRYELNPDDYLAADRAAREDGLDIVGIWHTHPDHPAEPSRTDREAAWEGFTYLILSVRRGKVTEARCWRLEDGEFREETRVTEASEATMSDPTTEAA